MNAIARTLVAAVVLSATAFGAKAQYYQLANQVTDMLQTALSGSQSYRGFVDVSYLGGIGSKKANFLELSTTQGFKYSNLFFMGVGAGIDYMHTFVADNAYSPAASGKEYTQNAAMVPLYTDFRLNLGNPAATSFFADVRIGAAFYISGDYILLGNGYINSSQSFYLRPTIGARIPISKSNPKYAVNVGATYQLLTNSYWYNPGMKNNISLNNIGATISFEW